MVGKTTEAGLEDCELLIGFDTQVWDTRWRSCKSEIRGLGQGSDWGPAWDQSSLSVFQHQRRNKTFR